MFIPLNSVKENGWPNVLAIGDTASVFFLLSLLAPYKLNVFIADTGVDSSMPLQFRRGEKSAPDVAAAYYDFFDSPYRIGAGALRRMNLIVYTVGRGYVSGWARRFRVPSAFMKRRPDGAIFEIEGALPDAGSLVGSRTVEGAISAVLLGLADAAASGRYAASSSIVTVDADGSGRVYPPAERKLPGEDRPGGDGLQRLGRHRRSAAARRERRHRHTGFFRAGPHIRQPHGGTEADRARRSRAPRAEDRRAEREVY